MEVVALLLIVYFFLGAGICLLICVNPNDPGCLGGLNRFVFKAIPRMFSNAIRAIFGQRVLNWLGGIKHYLLETNHPIVQIFYLLIAVGGFGAYEIYGVIKHMPNSQVSQTQVIIANLLAFICFWTYYKACSVSPGEVTAKNTNQLAEKYGKYYDGVIYKRNNKCKTCNFNKPARSKHCSICQMCVSKYDHHCVWIRQCVGQKNYKYFVSFLGLHSLWCLFLSKIGTQSLIEYLNRIRFWGMVFNVNGQNTKPTPMLALQFLFVSQTIFFFLIVMCGIMGVTLLIFVMYHFYLIGQGQTTNERVKNNDQTDYYKKELKAISKWELRFKPKGQPEVKEIQFRGQMVTQQDLHEYKEQCKRRLADLERPIDTKSYFQKVDEVFKA